MPQDPRGQTLRRQTLESNGTRDLQPPLNKAQGRILFSRIQVAREVLKERAEVLIHEFLDIAQKAKDAGQYEVAAKQIQWLLDHLPSDEDGTRVLGASVDKALPTEVKDNRPHIQIGIQLGGVNQKALPEAKVETIDALPNVKQTNS